jgi:hypothetical protein
MFKASLAAVITVLAWHPAYGSTIDTFAFTEMTFNTYSTSTGVGEPAPNGLLMGSFTGVVAPDGFIEQSDLSAFNARFYFPGSSGAAPINLAQLTLFSYDVGGGAQTLDFAGSPSQAGNICVGAAVALDGNCNADFLAAYPPETTGVVEEFGQLDYIASDTPAITLVSSVTPPSSVPEPGTLALIGVALVALSAARGSGKRRCRRLLGERSENLSQ